jgi:hypothetical protein
MTTLFDSATIVKPNTFGAHLLASRPTYTRPFTDADARWAAQVFGELADDFDVIDVDFRAAESEAQDRLERGLCC